MTTDQFRRHDTRTTEITVQFVSLPDDSPDVSYLEQAEFADRLAAYNAGEFGFIGIRVRVIRHDWHSGVRTVIESPGLWGIETDSDRDYLLEVGREELAGLMSELAARNIDIAGLEPELIDG